MAKNWDNEATFGSDILGCGTYLFIHGGAGKAKMTTQIGFVRQNAGRKSKRSSNTKNVHRKGGVSLKGRSQAGKARSKQKKG